MRASVLSLRWPAEWTALHHQFPPPPPLRRRRPPSCVPASRPTAPACALSAPRAPPARPSLSSLASAASRTAPARPPSPVSPAAPAPTPARAWFRPLGSGAGASWPRNAQPGVTSSTSSPQSRLTGRSLRRVATDSLSRRRPRQQARVFLSALSAGGCPVIPPAQTLVLPQNDFETQTSRYFAVGGARPLRLPIRPAARSARCSARPCFRSAHSSRLCSRRQHGAGVHFPRKWVRLGRARHGACAPLHLARFLHRARSYNLPRTVVCPLARTHLATRMVAGCRRSGDVAPGSPGVPQRDRARHR